MDNYSSQLNRLFSALSDPTRRAIVSRLATGPATVSELSEPFSIALPNFLKHIRILERCGMIKTLKKGRIRVCAITPDALSDTEKWLVAQRQQMVGQLARMEAYVDTLTAKQKTSQSKQIHKD